MNLLSEWFKFFSILILNREIMPKKCLERTFGMIKPEAIERGLVEEIERRIHDADLRIEDKKTVHMNEIQFESIYGHTKGKVPEIYSDLKEHLMKNPVYVLKISGCDAVNKLLRIRGSSNPAESLPGTIRGDYAKDQDYKKLLKLGKTAKNVFHASDSLEEARRDLHMFFGE